MLSENQAILSAVINASNGNVDGVIRAINCCVEKNFRHNMQRHYEEKQRELLEKLSIVTEIITRLRGW